MILDDYFPEEEIGKEEVKSKIQISNRLSGCNLKENIYGTLVYTPQLKDNKFNLSMELTFPLESSKSAGKENSNPIKIKLGHCTFKMVT